MSVQNPIVANCCLSAYKRYIDSGFLYRYWAFFPKRTRNYVTIPGFFLLAQNDGDIDILERENRAIANIAKTPNVFAACVCIVMLDDHANIAAIAARINLRSNGEAQKKGYILPAQSLSEGKMELGVCPPSNIEIPWKIDIISQPVNKAS